MGLIKVKTPWRFLTSSGVEITAGSGFQLGGTAGHFWLKNDSTGTRLVLSYFALGAGAGLGPTVISADISAPSWYSTCIGGIWGETADLAPGDFVGFCRFSNVQANAAAGGTLSEVKFGLPVPLLPPGLDFCLAKAVCVIFGVNFGWQAGVGAMQYEVHVTAVT